MKRKSWLFWSFVGMAATLLLVGGTAVVYSMYYAQRALPGVSVAGEPVTGMERAEVEDLLAARVDATTISVTVEGETTPVTLDDLGYTVDTAAMVDAAFSGNQGLVDRFTALSQPLNVDPLVKFDPDVQAAYSQELAQSVGSPAVNATVSLDKETHTYDVQPGQAGASLDATSLDEAARQSAQTLTSGQVVLSVNQVDPVITTADAERVANAANRIIEAPVELTTTLNVYSPDAAKKASWLELPAAFTGDISTIAADQTVSTEVTINKEKVAAWVEETTSASNDDPVPGLRNINSRGDVVQIVTEGEPGWEANNTEELTAGLLAALPLGEGFTQQIKYDEVENTEWEEQTIADGAEDLAYQAAKGEKWIDVNLSNFTTTAYEGATVVRGPVSTVIGAPGTETVTGKYDVWAKVATQTMRGDNLDGTKYETPDVPWILYFHGGYALHGAYWRSSFGYGGAAGSHGCVNMPVDEAKWFYDWASVGTPVVSHY